MNTKRLVRISVLAVILFISQVSIAYLPNIELVSLLIIVYSLIWEKDTKYICTVYVLMTALQWGFGLWWVSYLIVWPMWSIIVVALKKTVKDRWWLWACFSCAFGLCFGALFALPYIILVSPSYALTYWISGIPWDIIHGSGNFIITLVIGKPLYKILKIITRQINDQIT